MGLIGTLRAALDDARVRRQVRAAPAARIADAPEDALVRLTGVAGALDRRVLEAPLSARTCAYYVVEVLEITHKGHARVLASEQAGIPFVLADDSGAAVIDPGHARISTAYDHRTRSAAAFDASPAQRELLLRHDLVRRDWWNTRELRYREAIVAIGERVVVVGAGVRERDPDGRPSGLYRDAPPQRLRLTGTARFPLTITDDPRARPR